MSLGAKLADVWSVTPDPFIKDAGAWITPSQIWSKIAGNWTLIWPEAGTGGDTGTTPGVALDGQDFYVSDPNSPVSASYELRSDGNIYYSSSATATRIVGAWLVGGAVASDYEVMGTGTCEGTMDVWLPLSANQVWSEHTPAGTEETYVNLQIRDVATATLQAVGDINFHMEGTV